MNKKFLVGAIISSVLSVLYYFWMFTCWVCQDVTTDRSMKNCPKTISAQKDLPFVDDLPEIEEELNHKVAIGKMVAKGETLPNEAFYIKEPMFRCDSILKINTSMDASYIIKVVDPHDGDVIMMCYLPAGMSQEIDLPSGTFEVRYTCGTEWFGDDEMFGPNGVYAKADKLFTFSKGSGYELTLYRVPHGNLRTSTMKREDF